MLQSVSQYMGAFLQFANICIIAFGFYKFLGRPHSTLEQRVKVLEEDTKEIKSSLYMGNKRFKSQSKGITIIMKSIIALIEWEFQYCADEHKIPSEGLKNAKSELNAYLAGSKSYEDDDDE